MFTPAFFTSAPTGSSLRPPAGAEVNTPTSTEGTPRKEPTPVPRAQKHTAGHRSQSEEVACEIILSVSSGLLRWKTGDMSSSPRTQLKGREGAKLPFDLFMHTVAFVHMHTHQAHTQ